MRPTYRKMALESSLKITWFYLFSLPILLQENKIPAIAESHTARQWWARTRPQNCKVYIASSHGCKSLPSLDSLSCSSNLRQLTRQAKLLLLMRRRLRGNCSTHVGNLHIARGGPWLYTQGPMICTQGPGSSPLLQGEVDFAPPEGSCHKNTLLLFLITALCEPLLTR